MGLINVKSGRNLKRNVPEYFSDVSYNLSSAFSDFIKQAGRDTVAGAHCQTHGRPCRFGFSLSPRSLPVRPADFGRRPCREKHTVRSEMLRRIWRKRPREPWSLLEIITHAAAVAHMLAHARCEMCVRAPLEGIQCRNPSDACVKGYRRSGEDVFFLI